MNEDIRRQKGLEVSEIREKLETSALAVFVDFRGLTVGKINGLRRKLRAESGSMKIHKNTLMQRALDTMGVVQEGVLSGPTGLVTSMGDPAKVAKALVSFAAENEIFSLKGGLLHQVPLSIEDIRALATLPSREELLAKVVGGIKAPLTKLVYVLNNPLQGLVYTLTAIKDQKLGG